MGAQKVRVCFEVRVKEAGNLLGIVLETVSLRVVDNTQKLQPGQK